MTQRDPRTIDTNALVSAAITRLGAALVILAETQGRVRPCVSAEIIIAYQDARARPKCAVPPDQIVLVLAVSFPKSMAKRIGYDARCNRNQNGLRPMLYIIRRNCIEQ